MNGLPGYHGWKARQQSRGFNRFQTPFSTLLHGAIKGGMPRRGVKLCVCK